MPPLEAAEWGAGPSAARRPQAWRQRLGTPLAGSHVREPSLRPNPPCPALTAHMLPSLSGTQALSVKWSHLRLPWVDLDWLIDISCQITELDLSANCLSSLPSIIPWGLINLRKLDLSDNHLGELPSVQSSDEIICSRCVPAPRGPPLSPCTRPACSLRLLIQNCQLKKKRGAGGSARSPSLGSEVEAERSRGWFVRPLSALLGSGLADPDPCARDAQSWSCTREPAGGSRGSGPRLPPRLPGEAGRAPESAREVHGTRQHHAGRRSRELPFSGGQALGRASRLVGKASTSLQ